MTRSAMCLVVLLLGCGGPDDLSPSAVQSIPAGSASGSALSGTYSIRYHTTACSGACSSVIAGFSVSVCDVGTNQDTTATVTQNGGVLMADLDGVTPASFSGGVDADGGFDMGAYATQGGGTLNITARAQGTLAASSLSGSARSHTWGTLSGGSFDCRGEYDVTMR